MRPRFSIVIPTRERHQTLRHAIETVLFQEYTGYELVIQDNCSGPDTWAVVKQFGSPRLKYQRSPEVLPMNQNWEMALGACEGEYLYFMGDDDGLMPDGLRLANDILSRVDVDVLGWQKYTYWWDNAVEPALRGRMFLHVGSKFQVLETRPLLEAFYDWKIGFGIMPSIYNAFVKREVIERVRSITGGTYFTVGAPDSWTAIANAAVTPRVGVFERGLSMCGNSGFSTGCSYFFRSKGAEKRELYHREERKSIEEIVHPSLVPSVNLEISNADVQIRAKEVFFPRDDRLQVRIPVVLAGMAANINRDPETYDEVLAEMRQLAAKYAIDPATIPTPARSVAPRQPVQGPLFGAGEKLETLAVYCPAAGVHDVFQAARLASSILPVLTIH